MAQHLRTTDYVYSRNKLITMKAAGISARHKDIPTAICLLMVPEHLLSPLISVSLEDTGCVYTHSDTYTHNARRKTQLLLPAVI